MEAKKMLDHYAIKKGYDDWDDLSNLSTPSDVHYHTKEVMKLIKL